MSDLDRYQYGYDLNSNRLWKKSSVSQTAGVYLDESYNYDNLNRLTQMQRGNLSSGSISGTPVREMDYTLDPTGNWSAYLTKTNGTTDLSQSRVSNPVNEITGILTGFSYPAWATPSYDAAGNMTSMPQPASPTSSFTATYDAWNRMTSINNSSGSVAIYQYDGRGRRIAKTTPTETRHFYYTDQWQDIEERTGTSTTMDKQYVWGVRYVDELVCRDDTTPQRLYAMQDANFNLTSICNNSGGVVERYLFDPYGTRTIMNASWGTISSSACGLVIGHLGLALDTESELLYSRFRLFSASTGSWIQRDLIFTLHDGSSVLFDLGNQLTELYVYEQGNPVNSLDATGLTTTQSSPTTKPSPTTAPVDPPVATGSICAPRGATITRPVPAGATVNSAPDSQKTYFYQPCWYDVDERGPQEGWQLCVTIVAYTFFAGSTITNTCMKGVWTATGVSDASAAQKATKKVLTICSTCIGLCENLA